MNCQSQREIQQTGSRNTSVERVLNTHDFVSFPMPVSGALAVAQMDKKSTKPVSLLVSKRLVPQSKTPFFSLVQEPPHGVQSFSRFFLKKTGR